MKFPTSGTILSVMLATFLHTGCDLLGSSSECGACQDALDHMHERITGQGCNPYSMNQAVARIDEHCGLNNSSIFIGYMTETCVLGQLAKADCEIRNPRMSGMEFWVIAPAQLPDTVYVVLELERDPAATIDFAFTPLSFGGKQIFNSPVGEGDRVTATLLDQTDDVLATNSNTVTFARSNYFLQRDIYLRFEASSMTYSISFDGWN